MIPSVDVTCSVDECGEPVDRKGFCQKHYMLRLYRPDLLT
jgi:hypothetical protein